MACDARISTLSHARQTDAVPGTPAKPILLLRSGRHVVRAAQALRTAFPGTDLFVLTRTGDDAALDEAEVDLAHRRPYVGRRFSPVGVLALALRRLLGLEPAGRVAVLWATPDGLGFDNVTWAGFTLAAGGVLAITPDGTVAEVRPWRLLQARCRHAVRQARDGWAHRVWQRVWRLEGPELEPRLWHSHYLALQAIARDLPAMGHDLEGVVIDVGSGTGLARRYLDPTRTRYVPTDLPTGRDAHDWSISRMGMRPLVHCSGYRLPFADGSVDGVLSSAVLEHVTEPLAMLVEAARVLRPGGRLLAYVPFVFPVHGEPHDFRRWTPYGLEADVAHTGLVVRRTALVGGSLASVVINALVVLKMEVAGRATGWTRLALGVAWPFVLLLQAALNLAASASRPREHTAFPMGVVVIAEKTVAS